MKSIDQPSSSAKKKTLKNKLIITGAFIGILLVIYFILQILILSKAGVDGRLSTIFTAGIFYTIFGVIFGLAIDEFFRPAEPPAAPEKKPSHKKKLG